MSTNIISDDRKRPVWVNSENTPLPPEWQNRLNYLHKDIGYLPIYRKCICCDEPARTDIHIDNTLCTSCREYWEQ